MNLFGKKPTAKDATRESKREMANATRGIEKEIGALQLEEKKLVLEIKRTAKTGNEAATKILARQLVQLRQKITSLQNSRAQMRGIATHTQAMHANTSVAAGMKGAAKAMGAMNKQMNPSKQLKMMQDFQKQSAKLDFTNEMMTDSIDSVLDDDQAEDESEELTNQVLDEIGVDIASQLSTAPKGRIAGKNVLNVERPDLDDELEKRVNRQETNVQDEVTKSPIVEPVVRNTEETIPEAIFPVLMDERMAAKLGDNIGLHSTQHEHNNHTINEDEFQNCAKTGAVTTDSRDKANSSSALMLKKFGPCSASPSFRPGGSNSRDIHKHKRRKKLGRNRLKYTVVSPTSPISKKRSLSMAALKIPDVKLKRIRKLIDMDVSMEVTELDDLRSAEVA